MKQVLNSPISNFQVHPEVQKTYREKDLDGFRFTMEKLGQQKPVEVIEKSGQLYIIDGISRFKCAQQLGLTSLIYQIVHVPDNKVMEHRSIGNLKTKRSFTEKCLSNDYYLNLLGSSQGKKRDCLGFKDFFNDENFGNVGKDRFDMACAMSDFDLRPSTLRKAHKIYLSQYNPNGKSELGLIELLDEGLISIDRAYNQMVKAEIKKKQLEKSKQARKLKSISNGKNYYKLYCKSSIKMDEVPNNSITLILDSHPYWRQRKYRNQDEMRHGQEATLKEYLENFRVFNEEKFQKLKPGGVLVTIIGETYQGGYQGICTKGEAIIDGIGFTMIDVPTWMKTNQKYTSHPYRFQNSQERIIVAYKPGAEPFFQPVYRKGSSKTFQPKKSSGGGYYMASPETCITNVITTPVYNTKELYEIDPEFTHDAPCPPELYKIFIEAYSQAGDTILDSFVGAGTIGVGLRMGRKVIGYDVDPLSIEFSKKRFEWFLNKGNENNLSVAA
jgi:DNA modification methylase